MARADDVASRIEARKRAFARKRAAEAAAWRLGRLFFPVFRPLARRAETSAARVLVVERILRIGDTLVARPALAAVRARHAGAEVAVVCSPALATLCRADPLVDRVIEAPAGVRGFRAAAAAARAFGAETAYVLVPDRLSPYLAWLAGAREIAGYDYAGRGVALTRRLRPPPRANVPAFLYPAGAPEIHAAQMWLELVDSTAAAPGSYPPFDAGAEAEAAARNFLVVAGLAGRRPLVVLHPGAANSSYLWPGANWVALARALAGDGVALAVTGGPGERRRAEEIAAPAGAAVAAEKLSLLETSALVKLADLAVTPDTAPVHIASTVGTPVVALYGPGDPTMWAPLGVRREIVAASGPCVGCKAASCFQKEHYCMESIAPETVAAKARALLADGRR